MSQTAQVSRGRWLLLSSLAFFLLFALLACYQKYRHLFAASYINVSLLDELAAAKIIEEPEPLGTDWPQWRGQRRDGVAFGKNLLLDWPEDGPKELWRIKGGEGYSSFAVSAGRAYTMLREGDKEVVLCLDVENKGKQLWKHEYLCTYTNGYGSGPRSTPTLDGDRLYTVGADGKFHCLDALTGKVLWQKDLLAEFNAPNLQWGIAFSPLIEGDLVITTPGGPQASIVAFNKYTGLNQWSALSEQAGYSSPLAITANGTRQIIVFGGKALLSVSAADGSVYWRFPWDVNADVNASTPIVFHTQRNGSRDDYIFISSGYDKGCALLKLIDEKGMPNVTEVYLNKQMRNHFSTSVRHGDYLYGFDETKLKCLDLKTGKSVWSESAFHKGSLLLIEDRLIVLSEKGKLALFEATPGPAASKVEDSRALALFRVLRNSQSRCWTMPVLADGRLLLRDEESIVCLDLRKP